MKFGDLKLGESFDYDGQRFRKTGPFTASPEDGEGSKAIPRSAKVAPLTDSEPTSSARPDQVSAANAAQAIDELHRLAREALTRLDDTSTVTELDSCHQHWRRRLGLDP